MEILGPHELAHVFAQLTNPADVVRVRAVCREWRALVSPPRVNGKPLANFLRTRPNEILEVACRLNSLDLAKYAVLHKATNLVDGFASACKIGNKEIALLMVKHRVNSFTWGFYYACFGGHKELVNIIISCNETARDNELRRVRIGGDCEHLEKLIILAYSNDFNFGLFGACAGGHKEIAELMISRDATDFNRGLEGACAGGHKELAELMISRGATDLKTGLTCACKRDHAEVAKLIGNLAPTVSCSHCGKLGAAHV